MRQPLIHLPFGHAQHAPDLGKRGPELLVDGDMEAAGVSDWITAALITKVSGWRPGSSGVQLLRAADNGSNAHARQNILTIGKVYETTGYGRGDGVGGVPKVINNGVAFWVGVDSSDWQRFREIFVAADTDFRLSQTNDNQYAEFDDVSVREVVLNDYDMEASGVTDWTAINNATLTKETGAAPEGGGTQVLRVEYTDTNDAMARQTTLTTSAVYHIRGWARGNDLGSGPDITSSGVLWSGTNSSDWQYFEFVFTAPGTALNLVNDGSTASSYSEFAGVEIREVMPRTLNTGKGGEELDAQLGDGSTSTTFPTKLPQCKGYEFDGGDYFKCGEHKFSGSKITIAVTMKMGPTWEAAAPGVFSWEETGVGASIVALLLGVQASAHMRFYCGGGSPTNAADIDYDRIGTPGTVCTIVGVYDGTDTIIFGNAVRGTDASSPVAPQTSTAEEIVIGARQNLTGLHKAGTKLFDVQVFPDIAWSQADVNIYHNEQMSKGYK